MEDYGDMCREIPAEGNLLMYVEMNKVWEVNKGEEGFSRQKEKVMGMD